MWTYEKKLQRPIVVCKPDVGMAKYLITAYGGADGELSAALKYLNQRYSMTNKQAKALLTDIGTEELGHLEMIATMVYKLVKDATPEQMRAAGMGSQFAEHDNALFYTDSSGNPCYTKIHNYYLVLSIFLCLMINTITYYQYTYRLSQNLYNFYSSVQQPYLLHLNQQKNLLLNHLQYYYGK